MNFDYDEEQQALQDAVRSLLAKQYGAFDSRRAVVADEPGFDEELWQRLAEMGVLGLPFDEEDGGMGAGPVEVGLVATELGRVLAPEPFVTSVVLAGALVAAVGGAEQRQAVLGPLAEGTRLPAFAHAEPGSRWRSSATRVTARAEGDRWHLDGTKEPVPHGARADLLVVSAALPDIGTGTGTGLFVVDGDAEGVTRQGYPTHDGGRAAVVRFAAAAATPLGRAGTDQTEAIEHALDLARMAACADLIGSMEGALGSTVDYLKSRRQFGVPLSTFQALKFRAADMYVALELARSLVLWATMVVAAGDRRTAGAAVARAALQVSRSGRKITQEAIQLHGGIGMTAEFAVGHYLSRLTAYEELLGNGDLHLGRLADRVGEYADLDPLDA